MKVYLLLISDSTFSVDWQESLFEHFTAEVHQLYTDAVPLEFFFPSEHVLFPMLLVKMTLEYSFPLMIFLFSPWLYVLNWRRKWQPTPVLLPGKIPWTEEGGRLQSMGLQRVRHDWVTSLSFHFMFSKLYLMSPLASQITFQSMLILTPQRSYIHIYPLSLQLSEFSNYSFCYSAVTQLLAFIFLNSDSSLSGLLLTFVILNFKI